MPKDDNLSKRKRPNGSLFNRNLNLKLSSDLLRFRLFPYLTSEDAVAMSIFSEELNKLPEYQQAIKVALIKLLHYTANADEENAKTIISRNYPLLLKKGEFTEEKCGQRKWKNISPLQYAAWAGDTLMVKMFVNHLLDDESRIEALEQLKEVQSKGTEHGAHLSAIYPIIEACDSYVSNYINLNYNYKGNYWIDVIAKNQLNSVVNFILWFCDKRNTFYNPQFQYRSLEILCGLKGNIKLNLNADSPLGVEYGLYKLSDGTVALQNGVAGIFLGNIESTSNAITRFCDVSTQELQKQIKSLEEMLSIDNPEEDQQVRKKVRR